MELRRTRKTNEKVEGINGARKAFDRIEDE